MRAAVTGVASQAQQSGSHRLANDTRARFGTFGGVFTPCVLMILGVILYLRLGQVTGQAGLLDCLIIIGCATSITALTALSLSSLATNTRVHSGGAYYLISRSLGVEYGGAIGPVFFLALATSVSLYVIGFAEALRWLFPDLGLSTRLCATGVNLFVLACVYIGAGWTLRLQFFILAVMLLSLVSFFSGAVPDFAPARLRENMTPAYGEGQSLFSAFALFFPAVTGIMAGANLSGDLEDPGRSIPRGTLAAILLTAMIYAGVAVLLAGSQSRGTLLADAFILGSAARWPDAVAAGIFAATLSSALSAMMGAPRVLQALARDGVFPSLRLFALGTGRNREPRRAILLTFAIAQAGVMLGELNTIAPLITMFFIITYGVINVSCFYETITANPSFRPRFRLSHWSIGLAGAIACLVAMLLIAPLWATGAILGMAVLLRQVSRRESESRWGDVQWGNAYENARRALLRLEEETYHPKSWRPSILAVKPGRWGPEYRLAEYASWLQGDRGIVSLAQVEYGDIEDRMQRRRQEQEYGRQFVRDEHLDAFYTVVVEDSLLSGLKALLQSHGIGCIRPNTVLLEWGPDAGLADLVETSREFECSVVAVATDGSLRRWETKSGPIDVWWHSRKNGALMLMFAHLISHAPAWRGRPIRLLHAVATTQEALKMKLALAELLATARIRAEPQIIVTADVCSAIGRVSRDSALLIAGMDPPGEANREVWHGRIQRMIAGQTEVMLVSNAGEMRLGD